MPIPNGLTKLVISGTLKSGAEIWACSLWLSGYDEPPDPDAFDPSTLDGSPRWDDFRDEILGRMSPDCSITAYDAYWYSGGAAASHLHTPVAHAGTGVGGQLPLQVATVLTLRTAVNTRRGRGRIYLPTTATAVMGEDHVFLGPRLDNLVNNAAAFFTGIHATGSKAAVVVSQTGGTTAPIVSCQADTIPDTQRRRRNKLVGAIHTAPVT